MACSTHIVECLRKRGIEPKIIDTKSIDGCVPENGIIYNENSFFHSPQDPDDIWTLDFTRNVYITGYQIHGEESHNWVRNWYVYTKDQNDWILIDSHPNNTFPRHSIFSFPNAINTRYIRFKGGSTQNGEYYLAFYYIKFFGCIKKVDLKNIFRTCKSTNYISRLLLLFAYIQMTIS